MSEKTCRKGLHQYKGKQCLECQKVTRAKYNLKHKEKTKVHKAKYYSSKKEYFKAKGDERYAKKKTEIKQYNTEWNKAHPNNRANTNLIHNFGISLEDHNNMVTAQNGVCAICEKNEVIIIKKTGKVKRLSVDHCHSTGKIRGLLCSTCNFAIGSLKDDPVLADKAAIYLRKHNKQEET